MNSKDRIFLDVSFIIVFFFLGYCFRAICCNNNNNEEVYLDRVVELQGELDELERQTNEVHQDQRRQINDQQAEIREFRNTNTLVVAVPSAPPVISATSPVIAREYTSPCFRRPRDYRS